MQVFGREGFVVVRAQATLWQALRCPVDKYVRPTMGVFRALFALFRTDRGVDVEYAQHGAPELKMVLVNPDINLR
jgi:hypothetical protein